MQKRRKRKFRSHARVNVVSHGHRAYLETTASGSAAAADMDQNVADQSAQIAELDRCRSEQEAASRRCDLGRTNLRNAVKHIVAVSARVTLANGESALLDGTPVRTDEDLIARVENVRKDASPNVELFVKKGLQPGFLDQLSNELAAFKNAKEALTAVGKRYTEANDRLDHTQREGDKVAAVLEGIFTTSPDAPVGALTAIKQARLIGPRVMDDEESKPAATDPPTPATEPSAAVTTSHAEPAATDAKAPDKVA